MDKGRWLACAAMGAVLLSPGYALAHGATQASPEALEARIAELEQALTLLRAEVEAQKAAQPAAAPSAAPRGDGVIRLPQTAPATQTAATPAPTPANGFRMGDHTITMGGFIKADATTTRYDGGDPASGDLLRDFYVPGSIPVGGANESTTTDFNARQTRFWIATDGLIGGRKVGSRIEMDFQSLPGAGDQRTTSPSNPALRRAFVTIDNWLIGQEWTNFQNIGVLPETADYLGPSEGTVFARQVQVRYTRGPFSIAVENPETTVTPFGGGARITADDNSLPDITARYAVARPWGEASLAGVLRQLKYENPGSAIDSSATGWGLSAAAKIRLGAQDDLRFMVTGGEGIGRYVGLNLSNDAVLDATGELDSIGLVAGFAAYRHVWAPGWRSNLIWSAQQIDNDTALTGLLVNRSTQSVRANLIWSPVAAFDVGAEVSFGERKLENGASGDLTRLQLFAKYGF